MGKIIDVAGVQEALDRAARDARHGPRDIRAGRFVHREASAAKLASRSSQTRNRSGRAVAQSKGDGHCGTFASARAVGRISEA